MSKYIDYESKLAPPWLRGPNAKAFLESTGAEKDVQVDRARQAALANLPDQGPADAMPFVGADRVLPQGSGETLAAWRERLRTTWTDPESWPSAGAHPPLLRALERAGFPTGISVGAVVIQRTLRYSYINAGLVVFATHSGWTFGAEGPAFWNQFGIVFAADVAGLDTATTLGDQLNAIVAQWKAGKARYMGAWVVVSGAIWGWPIGTQWGGGRIWGGVSRFVAPR